MNVTEVARQVNIPTPQLREIIPQLGFDIGKRAIQVDDRTARKIINQLNNSSIREKYLGKKSAQQIQDTQDTKDEESKKENGKVQIGETIVVKDLAQQMNMPVTKLILELMKNGVMASLNQSIDYETATIIAEDLGFKVEKIEGEKIDLEAEKEKRKKYLDDKKENLQPRAPVVTIMGHVDHGKTKLLDAIRETDVVAGEAGGITQHIGAYTIEKNKQLLTFIDTPGHEAFSAMRSRGAQVADIVILVVAADDGMQPQTIESISHIRSAGLPFIVAINKIDKAEANIDKLKSELAELDLTPEDWGGKTICVEISAKQRTNIDGLLDTLLLVYEMEKENIQANSNRDAVGTIIESHLDKGEGPVATVLIQTGTLKKSDTVKIGDVLGKIKVMKEWHGKSIEKAGPSMPVKIIGLKSVPDVGEILQVVANTKALKKEMRKNIKTKKSSFAKATADRRQNTKMQSGSKSEENGQDSEEIKKLNIILKTDVLGSQEAILESLDGLQQSDLVLNIVSCGLGNITEVDVENSEKQQALLIGFNVKPTTTVEQIARDKNIEIKTSKIIYELLDYIKGEMNKMFEDKIKVEIIGKMKVLKIFRTEKNSQIIGGKITEGKITSETKLNIYHNNELAGHADLIELQSGKQIVTEVLIDQEAGMKIQGFNEVEEGDVIEVIKEEKIKREI